MNPNDPYRWFSFSSYLRDRFRERVQKITVDAGFSCPNRDGTKSISGCTYCNNLAFNQQSKRRENGSLTVSIRKQVEAGIIKAFSKRKARLFMVYFQAYTNTYAPVQVLKSLYDQSLCHPGIVALAVGTRPDCINTEILDLLESYSDRYEVWLELGLQTVHDRTLERINRRHSFKDFLEAVDLCRNRRIKLCFHLIIGLTGETNRDNIQTATTIAGLPYHGLKLHALQVVKGTPMAKEFETGKLDLISEKEYVIRAADFLERTPPKIVIQRLGSDALGNTLVAPSWTENKRRIIQQIDDELKHRKTYQGYYL